MAFDMNRERVSVPASILRQAAAWHHKLEESPADAALHRDFSSWLACDEGHARAWALTRKAWRLSGDLAPAMKATRDGTEDSNSECRSGRIVSRRWHRKHRRIAFGAAAAIAACLLILVSPYDAATWVQADHITATGEMRAVTLRDGSTVTLNSDSAITADFSAGHRRIELLRGEAFFQVTHDADRRFVVEAETMTVTVTGTAFAVGITDQRLLVSVESGSVNVSNPGRKTGETALTHGQRAVVDRRTGILVRDTIGPETVASWRTGRVVVENVALSDVIDALARHHRGAIVVASPALNGKRVTGVYDLADPARALRVLVGPYGGVVREVTPYLLTVSAF